MTARLEEPSLLRLPFNKFAQIMRLSPAVRRSSSWDMAGFSEDWGLRVQFSESAAPVETKWINPYILQCILPPCASARYVVVTLHSPGRPNEIQHEGDNFFKYEDMIEQL